MKIPLRTKYTRKLALVMLLCSACNTASRAPSAQTLIRQQRKTVDGVPRLVVVPENVRAAKRASTANHTSVAPELVRAQLLSALIEYDNFFVLDPEEVTAGDLRKTPAPGTKGPFLIAVRVTEMSAKVEEDGTSFNMIKKRDTLAEEIMQVYAGFPLFLFGFYTGLPSAWQEETVKSIVGIDLSLTTRVKRRNPQLGERPGHIRKKLRRAQGWA